MPRVTLEGRDESLSNNYVSREGHTYFCGMTMCGLFYFFQSHPVLYFLIIRYYSWYVLSLNIHEHLEKISTCFPEIALVFLTKKKRGQPT